MKKLLPPSVLLVLVLVCMAAACDGTFVNYLLGTDHGGKSGGSVLPPGNPRTRYVAQNGIGDGSSWANASGDLQEMIDYAAVAGNNIDEIWVQAGIYMPARRKDGSSVRPTDFENTFTLKEGVKIYGGFAGNEAVLAQRDWKNHETTLSGDFADNDPKPYGSVWFGPTTNDNVYRVVWSEGLTPAAVLDGFTIRGGFFVYHTYDGSSFMPDDTCGGIYNTNSSPTLANLFITGNTALYGGGIMCRNGSSPTLTNVIITGNSSDAYGGGIYNDNSSPTLTNVIITDNKASSGGGVYNNNSLSTLTNVIIAGNYASNGGGIYNNSSSPILTNVTITGNAASNGGGIYNNNASLTLTNVTISGNYANSLGGGIDTANSSLIIQNSIIWGNDAGFSYQNMNSHGTGTPSYQNSLIEGSGGSGASWVGAFGADNGGNIDDDPHFVSHVLAPDAYTPTLDGIYRLNPGAAATAGMGSNYFGN